MSKDDTPRPHTPTTEPLQRAAMAKSWAYEAAKTFRSLGLEEHAKQIEDDADAAEAAAMKIYER